MTACRRWEGHISDWVMGDISDRERTRFASHLEKCSGCAAELAAQQQFQESLVMPARPAVQALNAWPEVARQLAAAKTPSPRRPLRFSLSFGLAGMLAAALLVAGIGLGGMLASNSTTQTQAIAQSAAPEDGYVTFLEQAAPLLLAVTNRQAPELVSASLSGSQAQAAEQRAAEALAEAARGLIAELENAGRDREAQLIGELELVFLQVANLSLRPDPGSLKILKAAIDDRGLLFQLTVEELRNLPAPNNDGA